MKSTVDKKILYGFAGAAAVLLIVGTISFRNNIKQEDDRAWVAHTNEVRFQLNEVLKAVVDGQTGMRGYAITGNEAFLEPYNNSRNALQLSADSVRSLTRDNARQQQKLDTLEQLITANIAFQEKVIEARRKSGLDSAAALIGSAAGNSTTNKIRALVGRAEAVENGLLIEREKISQASSRNFNTIFLALLSAILIVLAAVFFIIRSNLRALRKANTESEESNWILNGNSELGNLMEGNLDPEELATAVITQIAAYTEAQAGALYIASESFQWLQLKGAFAADKKLLESAEIKFGEGLVGQAALANRKTVIDQVPAGYFRIGSALGAKSPSQLLLVPFSFGNQVVGVAELATLKTFTPLQHKYLEFISDRVALAINAANDRMKMKELLEETQRQSEELEAQQEELRQSNEELTEKTGMLETSEAELKAQQEELQQTNEELEEKAVLLEEQKERLNNAKNDIEEKAQLLEVSGKYKSEFLANMSHELRTPLNSILILAQLLAENRNGTLSEKESDFARNICNSGNDLLQLINQILDLSKVEAGKMELDIVKLPLTEVLDAVCENFNPLAKNKNIDFTCKGDEAIMDRVVSTDKLRIDQVLKNLLSNAFKFTPAGGKVGMHIKAGRNAGELAFEVSDTGIGIAADKLGIIFEAFQQADGSSKRKFGGTGLGLSISKELAHVLGGEIAVKSEEGKGSVFTLFLPTEFNSQQALQSGRVEFRGWNPSGVIDVLSGYSGFKTAELQDDREALSEADKVILILEDDPGFAQALVELVHEKKYKAVVATKGDEGIAFAKKYNPFAILLDVNLPVMKGTEVLRQLKSDPKLRHIPVQIISGYDHKREGLHLGAFNFIMKPASQDDLSKALGRIEEFISRKMKKLLVVEDAKTQNSTIRELIGNGDVKSFPAYSGSEAYDMLISDSFDCIIMELGLPDMSGFDLLEKIKEDKSLNAIPIVVYTNSELHPGDEEKLNRLANTVVLKTADSHQRLLDETNLFLHRIQPKQQEKQGTHKLHKPGEVLKGKRVLLVDDDSRNLYSIVSVLNGQDVECITAENGKVAIEILEKNPGIDLVLMDVMMPEMDGFEATREIRNRQRFAKLPVIALTAKAMKGDREKCLEAGMSDYIAKPVNVDQLLSLMRVWLYKA